MSQLQEQLETYRESVLYLIDVSTSMEESGALDTSLDLVCKSIREAASQGTGHWDAGVIVYNTDGSTGTLVFLSLKEPAIDSLKSLIRCASNKEHRKQVISSADANYTTFLDALRLVKAELNQLHTRSTRRVVLITNDQDPIPANENAQSVARNLFSDITDSPALIDPIFIQTSNRSFSSFWHSLNYIPVFFRNSKKNESRSEWQHSPTLRPVSLKSLRESQRFRVLTGSRRKYVAFHGRLVIQDLEIGINGYNIIASRPRAPAARNIAVVKDENGNEHRELLVSEKVFANTWSGAAVTEEEKNDKSQRHFVLNKTTVGEDSTVPVDESVLNELFHIHDYETTTIEVESFVSTDAVHSHCEVIGHSTFIIPSDLELRNSKRAFVDLAESMRARAAVGVVTLYHPSFRKQTPLPGYLFASRPSESFADDPTFTPNVLGMYFIPLPFKDDLRTVPVNVQPLCHALDGCPEYKISKDSLERLLHKFRLPSGSEFNPYRFPNPRAAQFSYILECHALGVAIEMVHDDSGKPINIPLEQPDTTRPNYNRIAKSAGLLLKAIAHDYNCLCESDNEQSTKPAPLKIKNEDRERDQNDYGSVNVKHIKSDSDLQKEYVDLSLLPLRDLSSYKHRPSDKVINDFVGAYKQGNLCKFTVVQLRDFLSGFGDRNTRVKKSILVDNVKTLIETVLL